MDIYFADVFHIKVIDIEPLFLFVLNLIPVEKWNTLSIWRVWICHVRGQRASVCRAQLHHQQDLQDQNWRKEFLHCFCSTLSTKCFLVGFSSWGKHRAVCTAQQIKQCLTHVRHTAVKYKRKCICLNFLLCQLDRLFALVVPQMSQDEEHGFGCRFFKGTLKNYKMKVHLLKL